MKSIVEQVLDIFEGFRMDATPIDEYESIGKERLKAQMMIYINANVPIEFRMLGFPFKSNNLRDKVIGRLPDLGEQVALENFLTFDSKVKEVYAPGVRITLVSDGIVFNDVWEISDDATQAYHEVVRDMVKSDTIRWYNAKDFYPARLSLSEVRDKVMEQWGVTDAELSRDILTNPDVNFLYRGIIKFGTLELAIKSFASPTQLQKAAKVFARETMLRNQAYTNMLNHEFADYIRLSMHPSVNNGEKYSFRLIPSPTKKAWTSPWHCAILVDKEGDFATVHRKDAIAAGYKLVNLGGRPFYFIEN